MRAIWNGSISFGLVNIPVRLYSAAKERAITFKLLDKHDNSPIGYKKVSKSSEREVEQKDIVKGYEVEKGQFVVLEPDDFKKVSARKTELIDIVSFSDEHEIDSMLYDKPYYVEPLKKSAKAYGLLRDALEKSGKVGVAKFVMREKEHIGVLRPEDEILVLEQLRYKDELRDPDELNVPNAEYSKRELDLALSLVNSLSDHFDVAAYKDTYTVELQKIIKAKARGKLKAIKTPSEEVQATDVADILEALQRSLGKEKAHAR